MDAREIIRLAEIEGPQGVLRLISNRADVFRRDGRLAGSLYNLVRTEYIGAALILSLALRKSNLLPPDLAGGLESAERTDKYLWVTGVCHLLLPSVVERIKDAFEPGDVLFGWLYPW